MSNQIKEWIKKEDLEVGAAYEVYSRNINPAIWDGKHFHGVRIKFGNDFMDQEEHWDNGPPYGTVKPLRKLE